MTISVRDFINNNLYASQIYSCFPNCYKPLDTLIKERDMDINTVAHLIFYGYDRLANLPPLFLEPHIYLIGTGTGLAIGAFTAIVKEIRWPSIQTPSSEWYDWAVSVAPLTTKMKTVLGTLSGICSTANLISSVVWPKSFAVPCSLNLGISIGYNASKAVIVTIKNKGQKTGYELFKDSHYIKLGENEINLV